MKRLYEYTQNIRLAVLVALSVSVSINTWAHETRVETRDNSQRIANKDNGFLYQAKNVSVTSSSYVNLWSGDVNFSMHPKGSDGITIKVSGLYSGDKTKEFSYDSLDRMIDDHSDIDIKWYMVDHLMWVEVRPSGGGFFTPIRSTPFFFGGGDGFVNSFISSTFNVNLRYFNYDELKADVQQNYANSFSPFEDMTAGAVPVLVATM